MSHDLLTIFGQPKEAVTAYNCISQGIRRPIIKFCLA